MWTIQCTAPRSQPGRRCRPNGVTLNTLSSSAAAAEALRSWGSVTFATFASLRACVAEPSDAFTSRSGFSRPPHLPTFPPAPIPAKQPNLSNHLPIATNIAATLLPLLPAYVPLCLPAAPAIPPHSHSANGNRNSDPSRHSNSMYSSFPDPLVLFAIPLFRRLFRSWSFVFRIFTPASPAAPSDRIVHHLQRS